MEHNIAAFTEKFLVINNLKPVKKKRAPRLAQTDCDKGKRDLHIKRLEFKEDTLTSRGGNFH